MCLHWEASVAQLAEQLICNQQVVGSSPSTSSSSMDERREKWWAPLVFTEVRSGVHVAGLRQ